MDRMGWPVCGKCCEVAFFPWVGGPHHCVVIEPDEPKFIYGHCGQPIGTTGTHADLVAEQERIMFNQFERDLIAAVETGEFVLRSSSMLSITVNDAIETVASEYPNIRRESIHAAGRAFAEQLEWDNRMNEQAELDCDSGR